MKNLGRRQRKQNDSKLSDELLLVGWEAQNDVSRGKYVALKEEIKKRIKEDIKFGIVKEMSGQAYETDKPLIVHDGEGEGLRRCHMETVGVQKA